MRVTGSATTKQFACLYFPTCLKYISQTGPSTGPTSLALNLKSHTHISPHCQRSKNPGKTQHDDSTKQWLWPGWNAVAGCLRLVVGKLHHLWQPKRTRKYQEPSQLPWGLWYMNYPPALKKAHSYRDPEPQAKSFSYRYYTYVLIFIYIYVCVPLQTNIYLEDPPFPDHFPIGCLHGFWGLASVMTHRRYFNSFTSRARSSGPCDQKDEVTWPWFIFKQLQTKAKVEFVGYHEKLHMKFIHYQ